MDTAFTVGDNANVVPTDTCKNTVYCVASKNQFSSPEEFAIILCKHFLAEYPDIVNKVSIEVVKDDWQRIMAPNSRGVMSPHVHTFQRIGPMKPYAHAQGEKRKGTAARISLQAGFKGLEVLKTTQSGFTDFHKCKYTSLPEVTDRLVGTSVEAHWEYNSAAVARGNIDFNKVN
jgi:urate oxidase